MFGLAGPGLVWGQTAASSQDSDDSSQQVEQREDSYRRQMELEDARSKNRAYVDTTYTESGKLEKLDKLPPESRENIRDQLVDIIVENGQWEPSDVFAEYPYTPTEAAEADSELMEQELAAWEEQIEKYHEREAQAFGSYRGPVPGPGNPDGQEGGEPGEGSPGQQGGGQDTGESDDSSRSAGTYQPYQSGAASSDSEISTAGVSESALDFLRGGQSGSSGSARNQPSESGAQSRAMAEAQAGSESDADSQAQASSETAEAASQESAEQVAEQSARQDSESSDAESRESVTDVQLDTRGIIAIKDLDKLEGTETPAAADDSGEP